MTRKVQAKLDFRRSGRSHSGWLGMVAALLMILATPSLGGPLYYVFAQGSAGAQGGAGNPQSPFASGTLQQTTYALNPISLVSDGTFNGGIFDASANITGSITPGQLHAVVGATAGQFASGANAEGAATITEYWDDTLTVGGLPNGTPVNVLVTFILDSQASLSGVPSGTLANQATVSSNLSVADLTTGVHANIPTFTNSDASPDNGTQTATGILSTVAGRQLQLFLQMELTATASGDIIQVPLITASVDVGNTSSGYLDVLTPGATLTAASGASYSSPSTTPEPSSFLLVTPLLACCVGRWIGTRTGA
jgi:hypothetical protein